MGKPPSDTIKTVDKKQLARRAFLGDFAGAREEALPLGGGKRRRAPPANLLSPAKGKGTGDETDEAREAAEAPDPNVRLPDSAAGRKARRGTSKRLGLAADDAAGAKEHAAEEHADDEEHAAHVDANLRARLKNVAAQKD